jgi:hypothetical protein
MPDWVTYVLAGLDVILLVWGIVEHLGRRDFEQKAQEWVLIVQGISNACIKLRDDCEGGKVSSVEDAGGRADTLNSCAYSLHEAMKAAVARPTFLQRILAVFKRN